MADKYKITGRYEYRNADGAVEYFKERIEPGRNGQKKEFIFRHPGGTGRGGESLLYRLPDVIRARSVIINEGEKQADKLKSWGLCATSLDAGTGSKLTNSMITQLTGKRVAILRDNDEPGLTYALKLANALSGKCESLRIVLLPDLPVKGDVMDWDGSKAELLEIIKATSEFIPDPVPVKKVKEKKEFTRGKITPEMIEIAKSFPIDKLIDFQGGVSMAFCHRDSKPSLCHYKAANKARCHVCGLSFSTIDILKMRDNYSLVDAVIALQGV